MKHDLHTKANSTSAEENKLFLQVRRVFKTPPLVYFKDRNVFLKNGIWLKGLLVITPLANAEPATSHFTVIRKTTLTKNPVSQTLFSVRICVYFLFCIIYLVFKNPFRVGINSQCSLVRKLGPI